MTFLWVWVGVFVYVMVINGMSRTYTHTCLYLIPPSHPYHTYTTQQPHGPGPVLSSLVGAPPLASPLILLVLNLLAPETQARPRPPAPEVVAAAKSLRQLRCVFVSGAKKGRAGMSH